MSIEYRYITDSIWVFNQSTPLPSPLYTAISFASAQCNHFLFLRIIPNNNNNSNQNKQVTHHLLFTYTFNASLHSKQYLDGTAKREKKMMFVKINRIVCTMYTESIVPKVRNHYYYSLFMNSVSFFSSFFIFFFRYSVFTFIQETNFHK